MLRLWCTVRSSAQLRVAFALALIEPFWLPHADHEAPVLHCPASVSVFTAAGQPWGDATVFTTAIDNSGMPVTIHNNHSESSGGQVSDSFPIGQTVITFKATDEAGNVARCNVAVFVVGA